MKTPIVTINDFGFSTYSEDELADQLSVGRVEEVSVTAQKEIDQLRKRLNDMFDLVEPLVTKLRDTSSSEYIHWPKRGPIMVDMMARLLKLKEG